MGVCGSGCGFYLFHSFCFFFKSFESVKSKLSVTPGGVFSFEFLLETKKLKTKN